MTFFSKVVTFSRPVLINKLSQETKSNSKRQTDREGLEYFFVGLPPLQPVSPEGSMLFVLGSEFLHQNRESFVFGSVGDSGGVASGYIPEISPSKSAQMKLGWLQFSETVELISHLSFEAKTKIHTRQSVAEFPSLARGILPDFLLEVLETSDRQDVWSIEFALRRDFIVHPKDVLKVFIPNTYTTEPDLLGLMQQLPEKISVFNPRRPSIKYAHTKRNLRNWLL